MLYNLYLLFTILRGVVIDHKCSVLTVSLSLHGLLFVLLQELIEEEAKRPVGEKMAASEPTVDGRSQSISQTIYAENRVSSYFFHIF